LSIRDALGKNEGTVAAKGAEILGEYLTKVDENLLIVNERSNWIKQKTVLEKSVQELQVSSNLGAQRSAFHVLSDQLILVLSKYPNGTNLFRQHCPMAFGGKGGE
jgi:hypothetical protein